MRSAYAVSLLLLLSGSPCAQEAAEAGPGEPELVKAPLDFRGLEIEPLDDGGIRLSPEAMDRVDAWKLELWTRRRLAALDERVAEVEERLKAAEEKECELKVKSEELETKDERLQKEDAQNELGEAKRREKVARGEVWALRVLFVLKLLL